MKNASNGSSWDVLHEDGNHVLIQRGPQEAHNVDVSEGFEQFHFLLQTTVFPPCSIRVRRVQTGLLHSYQLALVGQATVHLVRRPQCLPELVEHLSVLL